MLIGHYGASFAAQATERRIPLWVLFVAVQWLDVVWSVLVLLGVEKVRIVPGITATNPLDLYYMPYTHSLVGALAWSGLAAFFYRAWRPGQGWKAGGLVGAAVFSHWVFDLLVHRPDLPLYDDTAKIGLGLWNFPLVAFVLEISLLVGGLALYLRGTSRRWPKWAVFCLLMAVIQAYVFFGPPPVSDRALALTALAIYAVFAGVAYWLERRDRKLSGAS